jgi:hypothetical protein
VEGTIENNRLSGYTDNYVRVQFPYHPSLENSIVRVKIGEYNGDTCDSEVIGVDSLLSNAVAPMPVLTIVNQ